MALKPLPYREVKRKLETAGFVEVSRKGSHIKFILRSEQGVRVVVVPHHREVVVGTLRSI